MEKCLDRIETLLEICENNCSAISSAQNGMLSLTTDMVRYCSSLDRFLGDETDK